MPHFFIDPDISIAKTIDTDFYNSERYYDLAREKIFIPTWLYAGCTEQVSEPGSACPFVLLENFLDEPLLLTRDKAGVKRCISNVCTHRGNLLVAEPCKLNKLTCRYHGRQFSLDGKFVSMPQFAEVKNFPTSADNLHQLPLYEWGPLLFTSLQPAFDPEDFFGEIKKRMAWFPMDKLIYRKDLSSNYRVKANWALYCENYLEGFHIPFVHPTLNASLDFSKYTTELYRYSNLQIGIAKEGESAFLLPESSPDYGKHIAAYYFWVFPNMMFNFYPWGLSLNVVQPLSVNETRVSFFTFVSDETLLEKGAGTGLDVVEQEDEKVVEAVQAGVRSRFYHSGRYSVTREQGTHHFHSLIARFIG